MLSNVFAKYQPEIVVHMAAQAIVRRSYADPVGTIATNVLGTAVVLDTVRESLAAATRAGYGDEDYSAVMKTLTAR